MRPYFLTALEDESFDCVVIVMGLHHLHPQLDEAFEEIYRILKPGGYLCFSEPHSGSLPYLFRKMWYKIDKYFENNEASLDLKALRGRFSEKYDFISENYFGGIAYLFVLNSMMFRIPLSVKRIISPLLIAMEGLFEKIPTKIFSCASINQWRKNPLCKEF